MTTINFGRWILIAAIAIAAVIGIAFLVPELGAANGNVHALFSTMQQGGAPHGSTVIWLGWAFGILILFLIVFIISLGAARRNKLRGLGWPLVLILALTMAAWTGVVLAYKGYLTNPDQPLLFGFPLPTGLMIFVMTPLMVLINILFVTRFPKSILTEEDVEKYKHLLDKQEDSAATHSNEHNQEEGS